VRYVRFRLAQGAIRGRPSREGYHFAVWNNLDDTFLPALGNLFELKATQRIGTDQVLNILYAAKKAGVKGFVLTILGDLSGRARKEISNVYRTARILPIILERADCAGPTGPGACRSRSSPRA
jgi:hypothetical protein